MTTNTQPQSRLMHQVSSQEDNTVTLRVPKPNLPVAVLGLVAFLTFFQTVQLLSISAKAGSSPAKIAPAVVTSTSGGSGSSADLPASQVGGC